MMRTLRLSARKPFTVESPSPAGLHRPTVKQENDMQAIVLWALRGWALITVIGLWGFMTYTFLVLSLMILGHKGGPL